MKPATKTALSRMGQKLAAAIELIVRDTHTHFDPRNFGRSPSRPNPTGADKAFQDALFRRGRSDLGAELLIGSGATAMLRDFKDT